MSFRRYPQRGGPGLHRTRGALAYLQAASNGQIGGKISARPWTNQRGLIEPITLVLG